MSGKIKKSFVFHSEWIEAIQDIPPDKAVTLITLLNDYSCNEVEPEIEDPIVRALFKAFKPQVDVDIKKYKNKCEKSSEAINKRWNKDKQESIPTNTNVYQRIDSVPTNTNVYQRIDSVPTNTNGTDNDIDNVKNNKLFLKKEKNKKEKEKKFVPPTVEEVRSYCLERKNGIDPEQFIAFYESQGWRKSSGAKVVNWQACVRTWEKNNFNKSPPKTSDEEIDEFIRKKIEGEI